MFLSIFTGMPMLVSMIALIGGIFLILSFFLHNATYTVSVDGLKVTYIPKFRWALVKTSERSFRWTDIKAYKLEDNIRKNTLDVKKVFTIYPKNHPSIVINNSTDTEKAEIANFYEAFVKFGKAEPAAVSQAQPVERSDKFKIIRKKSFFEKPIAKVVAIFFVAVTILIIAAVALFGAFSPANLFRIFVVLIPGTIFLLYKSFQRKPARRE